MSVDIPMKMVMRLRGQYYVDFEMEDGRTERVWVRPGHMEDYPHEVLINRVGWTWPDGERNTHRSSDWKPW